MSATSMKRFVLPVLAVALVALVTTGFTLPSTSSDATLPDGPEIGAAAPAFTLTDTNGTEHALADFAGQYVILEWLNFDCPFVKRHYQTGNMQQLQQRAAENDVVWLSIVSSAPGKQGHFSNEVMNERAAQVEAQQAAILMDESGTVGRAYEAATTPHMYVIAPDGTLIYKGGIDDKPRGPIAEATDYVGAAVEAHMQGEPVAVPTSVPYGCSVKYATAG
ncbi:MAG: redoxin domain-containing protein [Bacteroidota bacterium]